MGRDYSFIKGRKYGIVAPVRDVGNFLTEWGQISSNITSAILYVRREEESETFMARWGGIICARDCGIGVVGSELLRIVVPGINIVYLDGERVEVLESPRSKIVFSSETNPLVASWFTEAEVIQRPFRVYCPLRLPHFRPF